MKKLYLFIALIASTPQALPNKPLTETSVVSTFEPSQITEGTTPSTTQAAKNSELSKYLYLRNHLNAGFTLNQWALHHGIDFVKFALSVCCGLGVAVLANKIPLEWFQDNFHPEDNQHWSSVIGGLVSYLFIWNKLLKSEIIAQPNVTILKNLIQNWQMHKPNIPTEFYKSFDALSEYYERSKKTFSITEQEARSIVSNLLSTCEQQINGLKISAHEPKESSEESEASFNFVSFFKN